MSEVARSDNQQIMAKLDRLAEEVARMRALQETETARCPHREDIARAKNNVARIEKVESKLVEVDDAIGALKTAILKVAEFVEKHPEVKELDLNPVFAYPDGAIAVDARIVVAEA